MRTLLASLVMFAPAYAEHIKVKFDPAATKVEFTLGATGHTVHGAFQLTSGEMWLDPGTGAAGGQLVVNAESGESGSNGRDKRMRNNVLQANTYPRVVFTPDRVIGKVADSGDSEFQVHGLLDLHGSAHELTMSVKTHVEKGQFSGTAMFDVPYVKWGMPNPSSFLLKVNDTVNVTVEGNGQIGFGAKGGTE